MMANKIIILVSVFLLLFFTGCGTPVQENMENLSEEKQKFEENRFCTMEYDPVCGLEGGIEKTFSNKCVAGNNEILYVGECQ